MWCFWNIFYNKTRCYGCIFGFSDLKICDIFLIGLYFLCTKFVDRITSSVLVMQISIFSFWKPMLQIASQNVPELNAVNFFSVTVKDTGFPDSQSEINLVIFHLNYILIHLDIFPYSVLNWEYLKMSVLGMHNINDCVHLHGLNKNKVEFPEEIKKVEFSGLLVLGLKISKGFDNKIL